MLGKLLVKVTETRIFKIYLWNFDWLFININVKLPCGCIKFISTIQCECILRLHACKRRSNLFLWV